MKHDLTIKNKQGHIVTSVWCHHGNNRLCQFTNLCYNSEEDEFVMFRDKDSIMENAEVIDGSMVLDLSSVQDHNTMQATTSVLPSKYSKQFNTQWHDRKTLIFKRFLPSNIMHMFHDDILPLHQTLKYLSYGSHENNFHPFDIQLITFNSSEEELDKEIEAFYKIFSTHSLKSKNDLKVSGYLTCFNDVTIGLSTRTTWYNYGFKTPQGPLSEIHLTNEHVYSTSEYISNHLGNELNENRDSNFIVLLTRKENRKITNEVNLMLEIVRKSRLKVIILSLETHSLSEIISYIKNCKGIVGMHGSLLILSIFLRPFSFLVEMFPYAINPEKYTPYRTLCQTGRKDVVYMAWANQKAENSIGHPDWSAELGGINHLDEKQREQILSQTEVPPHICCSDPSWLYHIYQDTLVDVPEVTSLIQSSIAKLDHLQLNENKWQYLSESFSPSKVKHVACKILHQSASDLQYHLHIQFDLPWTLSLTEAGTRDVSFEILIQDISTKEGAFYTHKVTEDSATITVHRDGNFVVWVRCITDSVNMGPYSDSVYCIED